MRRKWEKRIERRRPSSESDDECFVTDKVVDKTTLSRNASNKALAWESRFTEKKDETSDRPPPMRNMTLDIDAEDEPGLDSLSKTELEQLANELESDEQVEVASSEQPTDSTVQVEQDIEEVTALVTQTAIDNAIDDLKEQSLAESVESFDKSEQVHSTIITSSSSNETSNNESMSLDNIVVEEQSEELPTDAQTEEVSTTEDQVFEMTEMNTPAELKTPDDLKTPDFAKGKLGHKDGECREYFRLVIFS